MVTALHLGALGVGAFGACCAVAAPRMLRLRELVLSILMLVAMADAALGIGMLASVFWCALLAAAAVALMAGVRRASAVHRAALAHSAVGAIVMALLMLAMGSHPAEAGVDGGHAHGGAPASLVVPAVAAGVVYALVSFVAPAHARPIARVQQASMGLSTLLMAAAAAWAV